MYVESGCYGKEMSKSELIKCFESLDREQLQYLWDLYYEDMLMKGESD